MVPSFSSWSTSSTASAPPQKDQLALQHPRSASTSSQDLKDKPKKPRHRHSAFQLAALNELYDKDEHPPLEERTSLAERLGMEVKTVNAWFQNKRASCKKRNNKAANNTTGSSSSSGGTAASNQFELPPISALIASVSPHDYDDSEDDHQYLDRLPPISSSSSSSQQQQRPARSRGLFYAASSQHQHLFDTEMNTQRKGRSRPSAAQTEELRKLYEMNPHPSKEEREELGHRIGMRYQSVTNWFQNQRSIAKKRREEEDAQAASAREREHASSSRAQSYAHFPPSASVCHPSLSVPPATGHPSLLGFAAAALTPHRTIRSPSAAPVTATNSRASSPRPSPYANAFNERSSSVSGRPRRSRPEPYQLEALKKLFHRTATPSIEERGALAMEIGMDVGKVTNWFRNLRQTARKRSKQSSEHEDDDFDKDDEMSVSAYNDYSRNVSRAVSPAHSSLSDHDVRMDDMDQDLPDHVALRVKLEEEQKERSIYSHSLASNSRSSDMASEEDAQEAVTPSPASSPYPAFPQPVEKATLLSPKPQQNVTFTLGALSEMEKRPAQITTTGVKVEDAMLLLSFHHNVVR